METSRCVDHTRHVVTPENVVSEHHPELPRHGNPQAPTSPNEPEPWGL